jgi:hypothetical protein
MLCQTRPDKSGATRDQDFHLARNSVTQDARRLYNPTP